MSAEPGRMLTVREVARILRVSTATVYKLCTRGDLGHVRVLNSIRIHSSEIVGLPSSSPTSVHS